MSQRDNNTRYEAKRKAAGYVRGPRISAEAAKRLRELAFQLERSPSEVVSRLLIEAGENDARVTAVMREHRLSASEARYVVANDLDREAA